MKSVRYTRRMRARDPLSLAPCLPVVPWLLLSLFAGCGESDTESPSVVGYAWTVQIGGTSEPSLEATSVEFAGIERMEFEGDPKSGALDEFRESTPMSTVGTSSIGLPPLLPSLEAAEKTGLRIAAMTYCGFVNSAGAPREQDMQAVVDAVTALVSALESPLREATLSSESLKRAGVRATDVLLEALLEELDRQELSSSTNELVRDLQFRSDHAFDVHIAPLASTLPSLVWTFGDSTTQRTLRGCGSLLLFDIEPLEISQLPWNFPTDCVNPSAATACSLEAWWSIRSPILLRNPLESSSFVAWELHPNMILSPPRLHAR